MSEQERRCVFIACADHTRATDPRGVRGRADHEFFQDLIADVRDAGIIVYHRENYRGQQDASIVSNVKENLRACRFLFALVRRHSSSVGWEVGWAMGQGILDMRIVCLAPQDSYITRTWTGLADLGNAELRYYKRESDIQKLIIGIVQEVNS